MFTSSSCLWSASVLKMWLTGAREFIRCSMSLSQVIAQLRLSWKLEATISASSSWLRRPATLDLMLSQRRFSMSRLCLSPTVASGGIFASNDSPFTCRKFTFGSHTLTVFSSSYNNQVQPHSVNFIASQHHHNNTELSQSWRVHCTAYTHSSLHRLITFLHSVPTGVKENIFSPPTQLHCFYAQASFVSMYGPVWSFLYYQVSLTKHIRLQQCHSATHLQHLLQKLT